jgi:tetratricopeptide (TPR) repeat protein
LQKAAQLLPNDAETFNNLGSTLLGHGQSDDAVAALRRALEIKPDFAEAFSNLGNALRALDLHEEAAVNYQRALAIKPDFASARGNFAIALGKLGFLDEASQHYHAAISMIPDFIDGHYGLSQLKTYREDDPHCAMLEAQIGRISALSPDLRVRYWFALGKMREDLGRYEASFDAYQEGNRLQHAMLAPNDTHEVALLERIISVFSEELLAIHADSGYAGKAPIFIVGMPRSGTSLLEQILATYPGVYGAGELPDMSEVSRLTFRGQAPKPYPLAVPDLSAEDLRRMGENYATRVWRHAPDAARITDKMPANFFYVGLIRMILPHAKIIHAMRDPMDSCFSCYSRLFIKENQSFSYDLEMLGHYYVRYIKLMRHWQAVLPPGTMLDVRYEDMVANTEQQARRLLEFLDLPWDERCLAFHQNKRRVDTASAAQVRKPIYQTSLARWERFADHLTPLLDLVKDYRN